MNVEESIDFDTYCHPETFDIVTEIDSIIDLIPNIKPSLLKYIFCKGDCVQADCDLFKKIKDCMESIPYENQICELDTENNNPILHKDKLIYCEALIANDETVMPDNLIDGDGYSKDEDCVLNCIYKTRDICDKTTGELISGRTICIHQTSDEDYLNYHHCYDKYNNQRNCQETDCCPVIKTMKDSFDIVCTKEHKIFYPKYEFCQSRQLAKENEESDSEYLKEMVKMPQLVPLCGNNYKLYATYEALCEGMSSNPGLTAIPCPARCTAEVCCQQKCADTLQPVVVDAGADLFMVFINRCHANCSHRGMSILHTCKPGTAKDDCLVESCIKRNNCKKELNKPVCGIDGKVYLTPCEAACQNIDMVDYCVDMIGDTEESLLIRECVVECEKKLATTDEL